MNIEVHASFQISVFVFLKYILRSGIAGYCGSSSFSFDEELPYEDYLAKDTMFIWLTVENRERANPIPYQRVYEVVSLRDQLFINLENKTH